MTRPLYITSRAVLAGAMLFASPVLGQAVCEAPWTLEETLRIGSIDGEDALSGVLDLDVGPDGSVYMAQQFLPYVTVFSPDGQPSGRIGRAGSGPGEFDGWPGRLGWSGDTLWVTDHSTTTLFDADGDVLSQVDFRTLIPEEASSLRPGRPAGDGTFLTIRGATTAGGGSMDRFFAAERLPVLRASASGEAIDTIAIVRHQMSVGIPQERGGVGYTSHPLNGSWEGGFQQFAPAPDGASIFLIGEIRAREQPASFDLLRIAVTGDTLLHRRVPYEPRPVTDRDRSWLTEVFGNNQAGDYTPDSESSPFGARDEAARERDRRAAREAITFPEHHPPVREIVPGHDGSIWLLRELDVPDLVDRWEIYGPDGTLEGTVLVDDGRSSVVPWGPRMNVFRVTRDEIWGVTLGTFDEPYVHRYRVDRSCG